MTTHTQGYTVGSILLTAVVYYFAIKVVLGLVRRISYRPKWLSRRLRRFDRAHTWIASFWYAARMVKALGIIVKTAERMDGEVIEREQLHAVIWDALVSFIARSHGVEPLA